MKEKDVVLCRYRLADPLDMASRLSADVAEAVDIEPLDLDVTTDPLLEIVGVEPVAAGFGADRPEEMDVAHLRQRLHPGDAVAAVYPVVIPLHGDARNTS